MQQPRDVRPRVEELAVVGGREVRGQRRVGIGVLDVAATRGRVERVRTERRPFGHHVQVRGEAPGVVGLEHVVLEDVLLRVGPVVGNLAGVVVAHDVDARGQARAHVAGLGAGAAVRVLRAAVHPLLRLGHEAVHPSVVDVGHGVVDRVRAAVVDVGRIVERGHAAAVNRIRHAHSGRNPVSARVRAEVAVERAVLLHDDHDVLDLVDAGERGDLDPQRGRGRREVVNRGGNHRAPLLGAAGGEGMRGREAAVPLQPRPRDRLPARADAALERHHLAGAAGLEQAAERLGIAGDGERRAARQRYGRADVLGDGPAVKPARGHHPVAVGRDRAGRHHEAVGAGGVRDRALHRAETVLCREAAPQHDRDAAPPDAMVDPDERPEHGQLAPGGHRVGGREDRQAVRERGPAGLRRVLTGWGRPR